MLLTVLVYLSFLAPNFASPPYSCYFVNVYTKRYRVRLHVYMRASLHQTGGADVAGKGVPDAADLTTAVTRLVNDALAFHKELIIRRVGMTCYFCGFSG